MKQALFLISIAFTFLLSCSKPIEESMDQLLTAYADQNKLNGCVLVAQKGKILYQKGFGFRDAERKIPNDITSIFQIGSVTKQFTAAVVMQLEEEGKLSLQDKLSKYFSGFKNGDKITIRHLLTHTSGIFNYTTDTTIMNDVTRSYTDEKMLEVFRNYSPDFDPGTKWEYSNTGYYLLGYIIEKVEKKRYESVVRERIFQPLGMTNTGFDFTHLSNSNKAKGYFSLVSSAMPAPIFDSTISYAAGAIYSTVGDLYQWERAIYSDKILKPATWERVFTPFKNKYGYGWAITSNFGRLVTEHSGGVYGFASRILRFPKEELTIIILDNSSSRALPKISKTLAGIVFKLPYQLPEEKREIVVDRAILEKYVGEYKLPTFTVAISLKGTHLKALTPRQPELELYPEEENVFFLKAVEAKVEFLIDNGKVDGLIVYQNGRELRGKKIK